MLWKNIFSIVFIMFIDMRTSVYSDFVFSFNCCIKWKIDCNHMHPIILYIILSTVFLSAVKFESFLSIFIRIGGWKLHKQYSIYQE